MALEVIATIHHIDGTPSASEFEADDGKNLKSEQRTQLLKQSRRAPSQLLNTRFDGGVFFYNCHQEMQDLRFIPC